MSSLAAVGAHPTLPYRGRDRRKMRRLKLKVDTGAATSKVPQSGNHSVSWESLMEREISKTCYEYRVIFIANLNADG